MALFEVFIFLFLIVFSYQDLNDDFDGCFNTDINECKSISISGNEFHCCYISDGTSSKEVNFVISNILK